MAKDRFGRFMGIVQRHGVRPILAVVPDNRDTKLSVDNPDPEFWERMRALEAAGATIALHGFRHTCESEGRAILALHARSEFAGVPEEKQRAWIREGMGILRGHGLSPRLFVAPRHGFDCATLLALRDEGLGVLSDGFASRAFRRGGVIWIPQQLWEPVAKRKGLWTICLHTNTARPGLEEKLDLFLRDHAGQFTSVEEVLGRGEPVALRWNERIGEAMALGRRRLRSA